MRLFFNSLCILCVLFLNNSCKKDVGNTIIINGNITDSKLHTAVATAEVTFWSSRIESGTYNPNYVVLATTTTDGSGNYTIQATKGKDAGFRITVAKAKYFGQTIDILVDDLPAGTHTLNYSISPEAFFKLNVKNISFVDNTDFISYWFNNTQPTGISCCNNQPINYTGQYYENSVKCRTYGGQNMIVKWIVKKAGITTPYESPVYCAPFDTTVFNLNY